MNYTVSIIVVDEETHNVKRLRVEKPAGFAFTPGQAVELAINGAVRYCDICGPDDMVASVLLKLGVNESSIIHEL